jgi:cell wall-associated NlpC family hydrolase
MPTAHEFVQAARRMVGSRWRLHGRIPAAGLDCGGLLVAAMADVGIEAVDSLDYDARMPPPELLWSLCRQNGTEQPWSDQGEGRVGLCSWDRGDLPRHLVVMLAERRIAHVDASARRVVEVPAGWLDGRLLSVFRVNQIEYGAPW